MAKIHIVLDAGHAGQFNRSPVYSPYWESEMTWKLYRLLRQELEAYGFQVTGTRADQTKDMLVYNRGKAAKGADLFLSLHSNAGAEGDTVTDYPVAIVQLDGRGDELGKALASCVDSVMGTKQKGRIWTRANDAGGEWYGVLRGAASVGVVGIILEHSFHTNARAAKWLHSDANLARLAKAEAKVIAAHYGIKAPGKTQTQPAEYVLQYVVQAGAYRTKTTAASTQAAVKQLGLPVSLEYTGGLYKLLVGPYATRAAAETAQDKLKRAGLSSFIRQQSVARKSVEEVAREVIRGDWGVGQDRRDRLTAAGYSYTAVQAAVNKLVRG